MSTAALATSSLSSPPLQRCAPCNVETARSPLGTRRPLTSVLPHPRCQAVHFTGLAAALSSIVMFASPLSAMVGTAARVWRVPLWRHGTLIRIRILARSFPAEFASPMTPPSFLSAPPPSPSFSPDRLTLAAAPSYSPGQGAADAEYREHGLQPLLYGLYRQRLVVAVRLPPGRLVHPGGCRQCQQHHTHASLAQHCSPSSARRASPRSVQCQQRYMHASCAQPHPPRATGSPRRCPTPSAPCSACCSFSSLSSTPPPIHRKHSWCHVPPHRCHITASMSLLFFLFFAVRYPSTGGPGHVYDVAARLI